MPSKRVKFTDNSLAEAAADIYGGPVAPPVNVPDSGRRVAKPVDIFKIWPDPTQPRRTAPSEARAAWNGQPDSVIDVLLPAWLTLAEHQLGQPIDVKALIEGTVDLDRPKKGSLASFLELVNLAITLHTVDDDAVAPANIVRLDEEQYVLEFGERRWLAHHLLHKYFPGKHWDKMPAVEVKRYDVWRQAAENGARANLNAIGKARQLAKLLMDMYGGEENFRRIETFAQPGGSDRAYYAQVEDAEAFRIPYGKNEQVLAVMGLKDEAQIRRHRALLRIDDDLWVRADDEDLTESEIRRLVKARESVSPDTDSDHFQMPKSVQASFGKLKVIAPDDNPKVVKKHISAVRRYLEEIEQKMGL